MKIYTIGHSNIVTQSFIELLQLNGIESLADVRSSPYSQYVPQFNRENLMHSLERGRIEYWYFGEQLGGRPKDPTCYKNGRLPDGQTDFLKEVNYLVVMTKDFFLEGIGRLMRMAKEKKLAVMCSEEDPGQCHRHHLIARYLMTQDVEVIHIRGDGNLVNARHIRNLQGNHPAEQPELF